MVTEYGIADLRGQTDATVIERILNITDSRFQPGLIEQAQKAGKLPKDFQLDPRFTQNTPERLRDIAAHYPSLFTEYPLGCDFTAEERDLLRALNWLKSKLKLSEILDRAKPPSTRRNRKPSSSTCNACNWTTLRACARSCINACCWPGCRIQPG